jgi:hypothetical protein
MSPPASLMLRTGRALAWLVSSAVFLLTLPYALLVVALVGRPPARRPRRTRRWRPPRELVAQRGGRMMTSGSSGIDVDPGRPR